MPSSAIKFRLFRRPAASSALQAYDVLERLDPAPEYLAAKLGSAAGTLQVRNAI